MTAVVTTSPYITVTLLTYYYDILLEFKNKMKTFHLLVSVSVGGNDGTFYSSDV